MRTEKERLLKCKNVVAQSAAVYYRAIAQLIVQRVPLSAALCYCCGIAFHILRVYEERH